MKIISEKTLDTTEKISDILIEIAVIITTFAAIIDIPFIVILGLLTVMMSLLGISTVSYIRYIKYKKLYGEWVISK